MMKYITHEVAENTKHKSIKNSYEKNDISIVATEKVFWFESCHCSARVLDLAIREVERMFPNLMYFGKVQSNKVC